jgi:hypothetical protein
VSLSVPPGRDVFLAEFGHQDVPRSGAAVVVDDADHAVGRLLAVGIGDAGALVEQQAAAPRATVVGRDEGGQMRTARPLADRAVLDQQQVAGQQPRDEEPRAGVLDARRRQIGPRPAAVGGNALADPVFRAGQQPQRAVLALDEHVLVELPVLDRHVAGAADRPRPALVARDDHLGAVVGLSPRRSGQYPLAGRQHDGLAHHHAVGDPHRPPPLGLLFVRLVGLDAPHAADRGLVALGLCPEQTELAVRTHPEFRIEGPHRSVAVGIDDQHFLPSRSVVAAGAEHDVVVVVLAGRHAGVPVGPQPPAGRDGHARDALKGPIGRRMLRLRRTDVLRRREEGRFRGERGKTDQVRGDEKNQEASSEHGGSSLCGWVSLQLGEDL